MGLICLPGEVCLPGEGSRARHCVRRPGPVRQTGVIHEGRGMKDHGVKPGMNGANVYAAINADGPNKVGARDTEAGGTWGTIADKWNHQMHTAPRPDACSTRQPP